MHLRVTTLGKTVSTYITFIPITLVTSKEGTEGVRTGRDGDFALTCGSFSIQDHMKK